MDDPREQALVVGLHEQHEPVVAGGDDLVLQEPVGVMVAQVRLHHGRELAAQAHRGCGAARRGGATRRRPPRRSGGWRGGWPTATSVVSVTWDACAASRGRAFHPGHAVGDLDAALDERGHVEERPGLEVQARHPRPGQELRRRPAGRGRAVGPRPARRRTPSVVAGRRPRARRAGRRTGRSASTRSRPGPSRPAAGAGSESSRTRGSEGVSVQGFQANAKPSAT